MAKRLSLMNFQVEGNYVKEFLKLHFNFSGCMKEICLNAATPQQIRNNGCLALSFCEIATTLFWSWCLEATVWQCARQNAAEVHFVNAPRHLCIHFQSCSQGNPPMSIAITAEENAVVQRDECTRW